MLLGKFNSAELADCACREGEVFRGSKAATQRDASARTWRGMLEVFPKYAEFKWAAGVGVVILSDGCGAEI